MPDGYIGEMNTNTWYVYIHSKQAKDRGAFCFELKSSGLTIYQLCTLQKTWAGSHDLGRQYDKE